MKRAGYHEDGVDTVDLRLTFGHGIVAHVLHDSQEAFEGEFVQIGRFQTQERRLDGRFGELDQVDLLLPRPLRFSAILRLFALVLLVVLAVAVGRRGAPQSAVFVIAQHVEPVDKHS